MHSVFWFFVFSFSIYIAGILAIIRLKKINKVYYPFLICIWIGCINELLTFLLYKQHNTSAINSNIYILVESLLINVSSI